MDKLRTRVSIGLLSLSVLACGGQVTADPPETTAQKVVTTTEATTTTIGDFNRSLPATKWTTTTTQPRPTTTRRATTTTTQPTTTTLSVAAEEDLDETVDRVASADLSQEALEATYLLVLREWSLDQPYNMIDASTDAELLELGKLTCDAIDEGAGILDLFAVIFETWGVEDTVNLGASSYVLGVGIAAFCPEYEYMLADGLEQISQYTGG